jgi:hypothetical protein
MTFDSFSAWWATVDPAFAFLLALPFAVAAAGLVRLLFDRWRGGERA